MALIEVNNIEKIFEDGTHALRGLSFNIEQGEYVAIMGASGSGKSTLLHILGFLDSHSKGTYLFDGKAMYDYPPEDVAHVRNKKMGFVFQSFNLLGRTSVYDNVMLPLMYSDINEQEWDSRVREAVASVKLTHRIEHEPSELSGGERQRVAIARALVNRPSIIFADEPTGNLDTGSGKIIIGILQMLHDKGHTIILITHETRLAEHAHRLIMLEDGLMESDTNIKKPRRVEE